MVKLASGYGDGERHGCLPGTGNGYGNGYAYGFARDFPFSYNIGLIGAFAVSETFKAMGNMGYGCGYGKGYDTSFGRGNGKGNGHHHQKGSGDKHESGNGKGDYPVTLLIKRGNG